MSSTTIRSALALITVMVVAQGCSVNPSLRYNYTPSPQLSAAPAVRKIVVMKPLDMRGHAGTTPSHEAYIPFYPYVRQIREPEAFTLEWNGNRYDYELDFAELIAADLRAAGIAGDVAVSPDAKQISPLLTGPGRADYIIKLSLTRLEWQHKFTMYGVSVLGYLPEAFGAPDQYGFSQLAFTAEVLNSQGKPVAKRSFSAYESQNGWLYYFTGFLRSLTRAYEQVSPDFRQFVASSVSSGVVPAQAPAGGEAKKP